MAFAQALKHAAEDDAHARGEEGQAHDAQGGNADGKHIRVRIEKAQQHLRHQLEGRDAREHQAACAQHAVFENRHDTLRPAGAVVIGGNGQPRVVNAEYRHEDEALELEIRAENGLARLSQQGAGRRIVEAVEHQIEAVRHQGADCNHDHGGDADGEDSGDHPAVGPEAPQIQPHIGILLFVEEHGQKEGHNLTDDGRDCRARDAHARQAEPAENQDGIQNDVDHGAGSLGDHGVGGAAGGLQETLEENLSEDAEGGNRDHPDIAHAVGDGVRLRGQRAHIRFGAENAEKGAQKHPRKGEQQAVERGGIDLLLILLSQRAGEQRVDAHGDAAGNADHNILHRKGQRNGGQRIVVHVRNARDKNTVHHIVKRLYQHGQRHRQGHTEQQPPHRDDAHLVFLQTSAHTFFFSSE